MSPFPGQQVVPLGVCLIFPRSPPEAAVRKTGLAGILGNI